MNVQLELCHQHEREFSASCQHDHHHHGDALALQAPPSSIFLFARWMRLAHSPWRLVQWSESSHYQTPQSCHQNRTPSHHPMMTRCQNAACCNTGRQAWSQSNLVTWRSLHSSNTAHNFVKLHIAPDENNNRPRNQKSHHPTTSSCNFMPHTVVMAPKLQWHYANMSTNM